MVGLILNANPQPTLSPGIHCEINLDDCNPSTDPLTNEPKCFNKGQCVDRVGGYHCMCPAGYVGERCEGDVNECLSDPCDLRGSYNCVQLTNSYRCECRTGYTGTDHTLRNSNKCDYSVFMTD